MESFFFKVHAFMQKSNFFEEERLQNFRSLCILSHQSNIKERKTTMSKIKAAFACSRPESVQQVYGSDLINVLNALTELNPEFLTKGNAASGKFSETEVLFSTWGMPELDAADLDALPNLKAVFYAAGTTEYFHKPFLERGILISSAWKDNAVPVAEFVFAQIILALKNYFPLPDAVRKTKQWYGQAVGPGAYGTTVALIGDGAISTRVQNFLKLTDIQPVVIPTKREKRNHADLAAAFSKAQVVSNHLPDMEEDTGIFTADLFELMPENAVFINTGRGRQVNENDLIAVLKKRPDLTALLDVTYPEPPLPESELYILPNVRLSPHIAGSANMEVRRMAASAIEEFKRYRDGMDLQNSVQPL